jgi:transcriptional regulator with XRE-family HTH domain
MSFRDNLREALDFTGIEQKELAAKTGISLKTIENYVKKDSSVPSADKAVIIAKTLGVTVEYLNTGKNPPKPGIQTMYPQNKELFNNISQLNKYNLEVSTSMSKALLSLQGKDKP